MNIGIRKQKRIAALMFAIEFAILIVSVVIGAMGAGVGRLLLFALEVILIFAMAIVGIIAFGELRSRGRGDMALALVGTAVICVATAMTMLQPYISGGDSQKDIEAGMQPAIVRTPLEEKLDAWNAGDLGQGLSAAIELANSEEGHDQAVEIFTKIADSEDADEALRDNATSWLAKILVRQGKIDEAKGRLLAAYEANLQVSSGYLADLVASGYLEGDNLPKIEDIEQAIRTKGDNDWRYAGGLAYFVDAYSNDIQNHRRDDGSIVLSVAQELLDRALPCLRDAEASPNIDEFTAARVKLGWATYYSKFERKDDAQALAYLEALYDYAGSQANAVRGKAHMLTADLHYQNGHQYVYDGGSKDDEYAYQEYHEAAKHYAISWKLWPVATDNHSINNLIFQYADGEGLDIDQEATTKLAQDELPERIWQDVGVDPETIG